MTHSIRQSWASLPSRPSVACALLALICLSSGIDRVAASPQLISLVFSGQKVSPQRSGADAFRNVALKDGQGRIAVDERGSGTVGSEKALLAATLSGSIDVTIVTASVVSSTVPDLGIFDIPFLFRDDAHAKAVAEGPIGARIAAKSSEKGLVLLAIGKQGFRNITNSQRPIRGPADLVGLKIRVIPNEVYQMTFKTLGAEVIPMEFPLLFAALKDGRVQAQENPVATIASSHIYEVQKYMSLTRHFFSPILFLANREFFEGLDPADQAALKAAAKAGAEATWQADAADAQGLEDVRKGGVQVIETVDRQPFIDALKPLEPEFEKRFGRETLATIRSTR
jgi:tripartite ATP-independent transporter DctP family solute receptor